MFKITNNKRAEERIRRRRAEESLEKAKEAHFYR